MLFALAFWPLLAFALSKSLKKDGHLIAAGLAMLFAAPITFLFAFELSRGWFILSETSGVVALAILLVKAMHLK